jgi:predicted DNA-binding protein (MmcQ/YjbR family)
MAMASRDHARALWERARDKPGAVEDHPWGDTVFKVGGKIFTYLGRTEDGRATITVKPQPEELEALLSQPFAHRAHYIGRFGWVTLTVSDDETFELAKDLLDETYEQVAPKRRRRKT